MTAHSRLGPSAAHRYLRCPGSVNAEMGLTDTACYAAKEGTVFHEVAEMCLTTGLDPQDFLGDVFDVDGERIAVDEDMVRHMLPGLDWLREEAARSQMLVETRVDISPWCGPGQFGTADVILVNMEGDGEITVFDWKYGIAIPVGPEENDQAILYALGAWNHKDIGEYFGYLGYDEEKIRVNIVIEQPRAAGGGGTWTTTMADILARGQEIRRKVALTCGADAKRIAGPVQCKFCKAKEAPGGCPAYNDLMFEILGDEFDEDDVTLPGPGELTPAKRSQIILHKKMISDWLDQVQATVLADALAGNPTPGIKAVRGKAPARTYRDKDEAEAVLEAELGEDAFTKKLISPAQAEKKIGRQTFRALLGGCIETWEGKGRPILVPDSDKRPALIHVAEDDFDDNDI